MPTTITQNNNEVEITLDKPIITVTDNNKGTSVDIIQTNTSIVSIGIPGPRGPAGTVTNNTGMQVNGNLGVDGSIIGTSAIVASNSTAAAPHFLGHINFKSLSSQGNSAAGHITASGNISASGNLIISSSVDINTNNDRLANNYTYLVQDVNGNVKSDEKTKVLKVTGARMETIGSNPITVFEAPGVGKAIHISQITYFMDYSAPAANFPSLIVGQVQKHALSFYCIPADGISSTKVVPMGQFPRSMITANADTVVVRNIPSVNMRLGINKPVFLRYRKVSVSTDNSAGNSSTDPGSDFYFKIKYRVIDVRTDFDAVAVNDNASGSFRE